ncbi:hypothetical protein Q7M06_05700 (plasmid) [Candidatus Liberibacter asiaticus]
MNTVKLGVKHFDTRKRGRTTEIRADGWMKEDNSRRNFDRVQRVRD